MDNTRQVTAREINEVAIDLAQKEGFKLLAKSYGKMAASLATHTKGRGPILIDKDSALFKEIEKNRTVAA